MELQEAGIGRIVINRSGIHGPRSSTKRKYLAATIAQGTRTGSGERKNNLRGQPGSRSR